MYGFAGRDLGFDGVEETNELLMPVALNITTDDGPVEHVQRGKQRRCAVALEVMGHRSSAPFLQRQARLGAIQCLNLALSIHRQNDGVRRRIDIEANHVAQLVDELRIVRELELSNPMRLKTVGAPDALHRTDADLRRPAIIAPVQCVAFDRGIGQCQSHDPFGYFRFQRLDARGPRLVAQKALKTFLGETFLPAPDTGLRLGRSPHDLVAQPVSGEQDDLSPPDMLLWGVAVRQQRSKTTAVGPRNNDRYAPVRWFQLGTQLSWTTSKSLEFVSAPGKVLIQNTIAIFLCSNSISIYFELCARSWPRE
jgi:hypothetical protein